MRGRAPGKSTESSSKERVMKKSLLSIALLLCAATGCEPDGGPVSVSGPDRQDYGPNRHPAENAHDYTLRQQGQIGPCGRAWDDFHASYFSWKNGTIPEEQHRALERAYNDCVAQNYR